MRSWDIFCRVVDNHGDAGVCWRLACQLVREHGGRVRLWIDDVSALTRLWPAVSASASRQQCEGVDVRAWIEGVKLDPDEQVHDVVIEAFACAVPSAFVDAMAARDPRPVWINLEYLSAEAWVDDCHGLPSPHPQLPLIKHFFFPGFGDRTGGLLREAGLIGRRDAFRADPAGRATWLRSIGVITAGAFENALGVSLFAYRNPAALSLLAAWITGSTPVLCVVPAGVLRAEIEEAVGQYPSIGRSVVQGNLQLAVIDWLAQPDYDLLLWASDINFVRGEDSFVRAQWAGAPMVWQIYPQEESVHVPKLRAFVARYSAGQRTEVAGAVGSLFDAWNGIGEVAPAWAAVEAVMPQWRVSAEHWARTLSARADLTSVLVKTAEGLLQCRVTQISSKSLNSYQDSL